MSEVAAGRIRNLREYVYPNKKIVCKILKILPGNIQLSLRRVTAKEREEIEERYKKEKTFGAMIKTVLKNSEELIKKIKEKYELWDFFDKVKEKPDLLSSFLKKDDAEKLAKVISEKKEKEKEVKKTIILKSLAESGIDEIKKVLDVKNVTIKYLGSSQFSVAASAKDFKDANNKVNKALEEIQNYAKEKKAVFEIKEK